MKIKLLYTCIIGIILLCLPTKNFGQTLNLSTIEPFALFTVAGAVFNTGTSTITGNIGRHFGILANGAHSANVFWISEGAVSMGASVTTLAASVNLVSSCFKYLDSTNKNNLI